MPPPILEKTHQKNFYLFCKNADLAPIIQVWAACPDNHRDLLQAEHHKGFRAACAAGHLQILNWLWQQASTLFNPLIMIETKEYDAVTAACAEGQLDALIWLWDKIPEDQRLQALQANQCAAFRYACAVGHQPMIAWLWGQYALLSNTLEALAANNYDAFYLACTNGHQSVAQWLWTQCPEATQQKMLKVNQYAVFWDTCAAGHAALIAWLWSLCPVEKQLAMLQANKYACIKKTLSGERTEVFHFLWSIASIQNQIRGWWGNILRELVLNKELTPGNTRPQSSAIIAELFSDPHILRQLEENDTLSHYIGYFSADKQLYFQEIQKVKESKNRFEMALHEEGLHLSSGDIESAMRADLARKAREVQERVFENTEPLYQTYGSTDEIRLSCIERQIRRLIIEEIHAEASEDIRRYLQRHRRSLLMGEQASVHGLTQRLLADADANQKTAYIAWRAFDPLAETVDWPNLTTAPRMEDAHQECFSTKETYDEGTLCLGRACELTRQQVAHYFLACKDREETRTAFIRYLSEIRRAHNDTLLGRDSPSCYPGIVTRLSQMVRLHPDYEEFFELSNNFTPIEDAFYGKLSAVFMDQCRAFETIEEQYAHYDALAALRPSECYKILGDCYAASLGDNDLLAWIIHRNQILTGLLAEYDDPKQFIEQLLIRLETEGRIKRILPIDYHWCAYLLDSLAVSTSTLSKLFYQFQFLFKKTEASISDAEAEDNFVFFDFEGGSEALLFQYPLDQAVPLDMDAQNVQGTSTVLTTVADVVDVPPGQQGSVYSC